MTSQSSHRVAWSVVALSAAVAVFSSCTDEKIVFRDRELFNPPADQVNGMLGYFRESDKLTTCGNCHVGTQAAWKQTAHAGAYATLEASGAKQDLCEGCHTVSERGNALTTAAGWNAVKDSSYHDVQCESCHGPGLAHVENPEATKPIPSMSLGAAADQTCAQCHSGFHHPFAEEWAQSKHATPVAFAASRVECEGCHRGQAILKAWGENSTYLEKDDPEHLGIVCAVCHDPHGSANSKQLRFPINVASQEENLCIKCHHKRAEPEIEAATLRGPHSPEGPLLLGEGAGWFPPGFEPQLSRIRGSHGSDANPRICATCHVARFEVTDPQTGDLTFQATGHLFLPIPCLDPATGRPTTDQNCTLEERSFKGCTISGCHVDETAARSAFSSAKMRIDGLVVQVDALIAQAPAGEFNTSDGRFTVADGAWFNARLGELPGSSTHNPFLIEQLLLASINAMKKEYNLSTPAGVSLEVLLGKGTQ